MSRNLRFLPLLLLAFGVALADDAPVDKRAPKASDAQARKEPEPKAKANTQAQTPAQAQGQAQTQGPAQAQGPAPAQKEESDNLGMSILGNQEAPKALVIVPWKSSELGSSLGIAPLLDDSRQPVDKDVFMRALSYYEIRSNKTRQDGTPAGSDAPQPAPAAHRRKQ
jgi:hypothetical protein